MRDAARGHDDNGELQREGITRKETPCIDEPSVTTVAAAASAPEAVAGTRSGSRSGSGRGSGKP